MQLPKCLLRATVTRISLSHRISLGLELTSQCAVHAAKITAIRRAAGLGSSNAATAGSHLGTSRARLGALGKPRSTRPAAAAASLAQGTAGPRPPTFSWTASSAMTMTTTAAVWSWSAWSFPGTIVSRSNSTSLATASLVPQPPAWRAEGAALPTPRGALYWSRPPCLPSLMLRLSGSVGGALAARACVLVLAGLWPPLPLWISPSRTRRAAAARPLPKGAVGT